MIESTRTIVVRDGDGDSGDLLRVVELGRVDREGDAHGRVVELRVEGTPWLTLTDLDALATALRQLHDEIAQTS